MSCLGNVTTAASDHQIGQAIGGYIGSVDLMEKFHNSECNYLKSKESISLNHEIETTLGQLPSRLQKELRAYLESPNFAGQMAENTKMIFDYLEIGQKDGIDLNTLCGGFIGILSLIHNEKKALFVKIMDVIKDE
jgi:hypothetical protein